MCALPCWSRQGVPAMLTQCQTGSIASACWPKSSRASGSMTDQSRRCLSSPHAVGSNIIGGIQNILKRKSRRSLKTAGSRDAIATLARSAVLQFTTYVKLHPKIPATTATSVGRIEDPPSWPI